jgi:hypothetical protein
LSSGDGVDKNDDKRRFKTSLIFFFGKRKIFGKKCPATFDGISGEVRLIPGRWAALQRHLESTKGTIILISF